MNMQTLPDMLANFHPVPYINKPLDCSCRVSRKALTFKNIKESYNPRRPNNDISCEIDFVLLLPSPLVVSFPPVIEHPYHP